MRSSIYYTLLLSFLTFVDAQNALHNFGNLQIHDDGQLGLHTNLINNGVFEDNKGLVGFYNSDNELTISGVRSPRFYDMDVAVRDNLNLEINTRVINSVSYRQGNVVTPRDKDFISLDYLNEAIYVFESNNKLTDGYASFVGVDEFIFPIGDDRKLRPIIIPFRETTQKFSAAYFNEDPNFPSSFDTSFDTNEKVGIINQVSVDEFWDFNGDAETQVILTWDGASNIEDLTTELLDIRVVGWSIANEQWEDLGNFDVEGDLNTGKITSGLFVPDDYEAITFGGLVEVEDLVAHNLITKNGDEINRYFIIPGIEAFENVLTIYNRWGKIVFEEKNYKNKFEGIANKSSLFQEATLPTGLYFYVLQIFDGENSKDIASYLYIQ